MQNPTKAGQQFTAYGKSYTVRCFIDQNGNEHNSLESAKAISESVTISPVEKQGQILLAAAELIANLQNA